MGRSVKRYHNAAQLLPNKLLGELQHYAAGKVLYVPHPITEAAKKKPTPPGDGGGAPVNDTERIKQLEQENQQLKQQLVDLQKQIDTLLADKKAAANRAKAQTLVRKLERHGLSFGTDDEKEAEITRLASLSDEAFAASEAAYGRMTQAATPKSAPTDKPANAADTAKAEHATAPLRTDAGVRPLDVDDRSDSLEDQLKRGFQQAYDERLERMQS